jgi:hypothetical protein
MVKTDNKLSDYNRKTILKFCYDLQTEGISTTRQVKYLRILVPIAKMLGKDFNKASVFYSSPRLLPIVPVRELCVYSECLFAFDTRTERVLARDLVGSGRFRLVSLLHLLTEGVRVESCDCCFALLLSTSANRNLRPTLSDLLAFSVDLDFLYLIRSTKCIRTVRIRFCACG